METQTKDKPLFPDLLWSRPERKAQAGKLLAIGGSTHGFAPVIKAMELARQAGIGEVKAVLPKGVAKFLGNAPECVFVGQTATGSFARGAVEETRSYLDWADAVLVAEELTRNAETSIFLESLLSEVHKPAVVYGEGLDVLTNAVAKAELTDVIAIASLRQAQQLAKAAGAAEALLSSSTLEQRGRLLQALAETTRAVIVLADEGAYVAASGAKVCYMKADLDILSYAARAAVLTAQFPSRLYEAAVTAPII